jgi:hypothetical protein
MVNEKIYHPDNVYILNYRNKYSTIREFLEASYVDLPEELKQRHDIRVWMQQNIISASLDKKQLTF